ncbi:hypothetical protein TVAG_415620 [Trichomonas vaginalis G3]|uniref:Ras-GAP domain-containing protein n=1 Tax=Trichomonas vaginalis (strain ATCC PRA-98 / G3) TaxID=412133 RepID=A2G2K5_TRIV3|nr:Rasgap domain-containing protein [Trichomonas vaginalis G3]EAX88612.1 hypothetical protein TVAG_415620 [Trichomonas vaginalis G3]KAI5529725.1 Rasgap domain-containing protein [Trichomonas vaginalis G3]|eukprot:XP_001301542.1 hypothetical protein [Trichomonas vaginalis G3]
MSSAAPTEQQTQTADERKSHQDVLAGVAPCQYLNDIYNQPIILFEELGNRVAEFLKTPRYSEIPPYMEIPITESYKMFVNEFNNVPREQVFSPPQTIVDYTQYLSQQIPQKACFQIANAWPIAIPRISNTMEPLAAILIKMVSEANDPTAMLRFFSGVLFPKVWTNKPTAQNPVLLAASPCKFKGKSGHWAYILRESNEFFIVGYDKKTSTFVTKIQGIVSACAMSKNEESVIVKGDAGRIADFTPLDKEVVPLWTHLYKGENSSDEEEESSDKTEKKEVPFPYFFTKIDTYIPDIVYNAFYETCIANDLIVLRTCMLLDAPYEIADALLTIALHSRKVHTVFASVASFILEDDNCNPMEVISGRNFFCRFTMALYERFVSDYINNFMKKLVVYIDSHSKLDEKLFFSVIKYITMSSQYIPIQIRHFASILRSYAAMKFNSRGFVYLLLGAIFGITFVCEVIAKPTQVFEDYTPKNPELLKTISNMLKFVFRGAVLPDQFASANKRIVKHVLPTMEEFLFSLGDIADELPVYSAPSQEKTATAVAQVFNFILSHPQEFRKVYDGNLIENITYPPQIGWNFSVAIGDFFRQFYDRGAKRNKGNTVQKVKPPPLKFPQLPMYGVISAKKLGGGGGNVSYGGGAFEGSSFGLPARERDLNLPPKNYAMRLPLKPRNQDHNPLKKDLPDDDDLTTISDAPPMQARSRAADNISYQPPLPPPKLKVSTNAKEVSATETFSISDTTDDGGELARGKEAPSYMDTNDNDHHKKGRKQKVHKKIVIKDSGISGSKAELITQKVVNDGKSKVIVNTIRKTPRGVVNDNDSV